MPPVILIIIEYMRGLKYKGDNKQQNNQSLKDEKKTANISFFTILNDSIDKMTVSVFKLGGYIIIFSCLCAYIRHITYHLPSICMILCGILEITNGIYLVSDINNYILKILAILIINAFGGVSTLMQTAAIIKANIGCNIDLKKYIIKKLKLSLCTALILCLLMISGIV